MDYKQNTPIRRSGTKHLYTLQEGENETLLLVSECDVTPEMIEAGVSVLCAFDTTYERESVWAARIFRAMYQARKS